MVKAPPMGGQRKDGQKRQAAATGKGGQKDIASYFGRPETRSSSRRGAVSASGPSRPAQHSRSRVQPQVSTSASSDLDVRDASDPATASSQTSDYVDLTRDSEGTTSDFAPSDERALTEEESEKVSDDDEDASEDLVLRKPKRQKTLFGDSIVVEEDEQTGSKAKKGAARAKPTARNNDAWQYKGGISENLPPMHDLDEIFDDITKNSIEHGLASAVKHLASKKLRLATMCSGTESPVLALDLISESLMKQYGLKLDYEHVFSAEIVPYKQAYIERNFSPPLIFRDIRELIDSEYATTAYGARAKVPVDVDMLVAGFSCVDFSNLNYKKRDLEATGESGDTFRAVYNYAKTRRPTLIVLENVCSAPWERLKDSWALADYDAHFLRLDTKSYYLPHTRQRGYMVCIDRHKVGSSKKMADKWVSLMQELRRPASSSIEAFLLDEDDPRVHRGRAELSKGAHGGDKGPRDVDWTKCQGRHQDYRADLLLGSKRPLTGWEDNGSCRMPDYAWGDWGVKQVERIWDTFEISFLRNVRRGYDSQYKTRVWELSQNIDRFTDTTPFGITGCITPTGSPFLTNRGGLMIGLESLAMQGLPIEKLLLTRETQKQLQDLAGNAMSATVVGTAMMGALIVGYKGLEKGGGADMAIDKIVDVSETLTGEHKLVSRPLDLGHVNHKPLQSILADSVRSSRLCLCEGRAMITNNKLRRCRLCSHTTCERCGGTPVHKYEPLSDAEIASRVSPMTFEDQLKDALPMTTKLDGLSAATIDQIKAGCGLEINDKEWRMFKDGITPAFGVELRLHSLKRGQTWTVYYDSPTSRMELMLNSRMAEWRVFAKPNRSEPGNSPIRKLLARPFARMRPQGDSLIEGQWQLCLPAVHHFKVTVQGYNKLRPSWEANLGLQEPRFADKKVWTNLQLSVEQDKLARLDMDISGDYDLLPDCGTASGSLHKKQTQPDESPVFLFLDPSRLGNPIYDHFVFSPDIGRMNYGETRAVVATVDPKWRPSSTKEPTKIDCKVDGQWIVCPNVSFQPIASNQQASFATPPPQLPADFVGASCVAANVVLSCKVPLPGEEDSGWKKGDWVEVSKLNERQTFLAFAWLTERVRRIEGLGEWKTLTLGADSDRCLSCAPMPPKTKWKLAGDKDKLVPYEDTTQAAPYEHALKNRPAPFITQARIDENNVGALKIGLNVWSLVHRALANLPSHGSMEDVQVKWRLSTDYVPLPKLSFPKYGLLSNKSDEPSEQPPGFLYDLRIEQLRSAKWMVQQESKDAPPFVEEEIEETLLPQLGWRAEACATKAVSVRGGVLADQVGYGKTAITLGLIAMQAEKENKVRLVSPYGKIALKATLVIVPNTLVDQWIGEVRKFLGKNVKIVAIRGQANLTNETVAGLQDADIVITTWTIFNNETYLGKLAQFAALPDMPSSSGRAFDAWYAYAVSRSTEHVEVLRTFGAEALQKRLKSELVALENDEELIGSIPSKRLRGAAYRAALEKAPKKDAGKRSHSEMEDSSSAATPVRKKKTAGATDSKAGTDAFKLGSSIVRRDWTKMTCPLFQMFHWNRVVVDEYTYVAGKEHVCTTSLSANARWVLSGTPPLEDFADVKSISVFLGINLGVDDDAVGFIKAQTIKTMQKERTTVEQFHAFKQVHSPAWHERRNAVAQRFLDQFVRQNTAEIGEIPFEEHLRPIVLPAAERAIYLELHSHLMSQDMKIRQGKSRADGDRVRRLNQTLGASKTAEEALVKRCSHFTLDHLDSERENATKACDVVVVERQRQLEELETELQKNLRHAAWLKKDCKDNDMHYAGWKGNVAKNVFGDEFATMQLRKYIEDAERKTKESHEMEFYIDEKDIPRREAKTKKAQAGKAKVKAQKKKAPARKRRRRDDDILDDDSDEDAMLTDSDNEEVEEEDLRPVRLGTTAQKIQALRDLAGQLRRLSTEYVSRRRSLRFFKVVRELQTAYSKISTATDDAKVFTCSKCKREDLDRDTISVLTLCGHTACDNCRAEHSHEDTCIVPTCNAAARSFHIVRAAELGEEDLRASEGRHYGRKLEEVVKLCQDIPSDEQILLFVQFNDLLEKVSEALGDNGVSNVALTDSNRSSASALMNQFQTEKDVRKKNKVLILNVANESASGANLTNANHIIFLSPFLFQTQYHYDSTETQAIGRARRYGQQKLVHIYRFFSLKTIDVEILEHRTKQKLAKTGSERFELVDPSTVKPTESGAVEEWGGGGSLNKWGIDDSD